MEYLALYRKYRPINFDEMVGQNEIRSILSSSIKNNTISHAYLFSGPRGTGKTSTAKIFAKLINCENLVDGIPCGKCASCLSISNSNDVVEIDAASNNGVEEIRELREKANLVPSVCKYKVYIIDEVHMLTTQAFNALLKTLEEPPKHVIFILATTEYHKVPLTITSRCQKFQFNKLSVDDNFTRLKEISLNENIDITDNALYEIAKLSDGGMRDSINFLDQIRSYKQDKIDVDDVFYVCGTVSIDDIINLFKDIYNKNAYSVVNIIEEIGNKGKNYNKFLEEMLSILKDVILFKNDVLQENINNDINKITDLSSMYSVSDIYYIIDMINDLIDKLRYVSRQSIIVVTNFLLIMNKINSNNDVLLKFDKSKIDDNVKEGYDYAFSIPKKEEKASVKLTSNDVNLTDDNITLEDDIYFKNRDIIINNAFAKADKNIKSTLQKKWLTLDEYLLDKKYSHVVSKINSLSLEVASDEYLIFVTNYDSVVDYVYKNYKIFRELIEILFGKSFYVSLLNTDEWTKQRDLFISAHKNGIKYVIKDLIMENKEKNESAVEIKKNSVVDKLFDLVGEDSIEFK